MSKHTKGPWQIIEAEGYNTIEGAGETIAYVPSREDYRANFKTAEGQANRRLISAAPDMLEALITAVEILERNMPANCYMERGEMNKAICKALGLDYSTCKTADFEAAISKARGAK